MSPSTARHSLYVPSKTLELLRRHAIIHVTRIWFSGKTRPCQGRVGSSILPIRTSEHKGAYVGAFVRNLERTYLANIHGSFKIWCT